MLVVGTTPDYVEWIRRAAPLRALFLTDRALRRVAREEPPAAHEEVIADLADGSAACAALAEHLRRYRQDIAGVVCYDCESLELAATIARAHAVPYPSVEAVALCRDKLRSKRAWRRAGLDCPRSRVVQSAEAAARFRREVGRPLVLKPLAGSGSELVFRGDDAAGCRAAFAEIARGLERRRDNRLFRVRAAASPAVLAEELVAGDEYSCDFLIDRGEVTLLRLTRKLAAPDAPLGTIVGYLLEEPPPRGLAAARFAEVLRRSAEALGVHRALSMLDFIVRDGEPVLLELTPRPGGDCLPQLLRAARGLDVLGLALDFAGGRPLELGAAPAGERLVGLRFRARRAGTLVGIDDRALRSDRRVLSVEWLRAAGHAVRLPPDDYDSWLLGHAIVRPDSSAPPEEQCRALLELVEVRIEG